MRKLQRAKLSHRRVFMFQQIVEGLLRKLQSNPEFIMRLLPELHPDPESPRTETPHRRGCRALVAQTDFPPFALHALGAYLSAASDRQVEDAVNRVYDLAIQLEAAVAHAQRDVTTFSDHRFAVIAPTRTD
jgi:hypothetical protein